MRPKWQPINPKCCVCGRFTTWDADRSTPFGGPEDLEPPDDEFYCSKCAAEQESYYVERGWVPNDWMPAAWQERVARRLGFVRVAGAPGAAWSKWVRAEREVA